MAIWRGPGGPGDAVPDQANSAQLAENFANAAAASATAASTSASNAAASAAAALVSESNSSSSASQASTSASNAAASAAAALVSEQAAALSEANALASEQAAALSESNAASSESNAAASEANALASEQAAALSESNAASSESNAAASESKAQQWATEAEDVPVETSPTNLYSAFHWAQKAEDFAQTINPTDYVTVANNETITGVKTFDNGLNTDTISEETSAAGVTVDGVLLKDSQVSTDQINEKTSATGVTIDGVLLKDNAISATGPSVISVNSTSDALRITQTGSGNALLVEDSANPDATPFVVNNNGRIVVGNTVSTTNALIEVQGTGTTDNVISVQNYADNTNLPIFDFVKSRGTLGTNAIVNSGDVLGRLTFKGADGTAYIRGAQIVAAVDGTPGTNDMPGRLVFSTTADGASSPTERMRITNTGQVRLGAGTVSEPVLSTTGDTNTGIYFPAADTIGFVCGGTEDFRVDGTGQLWNTVESEVGTDYTTLYKGYFCRAWVNFNGTGTVAIRASGNVSSITDNGTGDYTVNFTTAMPDANYVITASAGGGSAAYVRPYDDATARTTSDFRLVSFATTSGTATDYSQINAVVLR